MSTREHHRPGRDSRHLCAACRDRKAKFRYQGQVRADRDHVLCFQCFRSLREQSRAKRLADLPRPRPARRELTPAETEHRLRMLAYLESRKAVASV